MVLEIPGGIFGQQDVRETAGVEPVPTIANFTDAQHNHSNAEGGGAVTDSTIDHNATTNTHNLTTDINHNTIANNHNLTTDIDHDQLTNFLATEHFLEGAIDHTAITNIGTNTHAQIDAHIGGTDQTEVRATHGISSATTWETLYTVTAGKTLFITTLIITNATPSTQDAALAQLGLSSTAILDVHVPAADSGTASPPNVIINLQTPLKFTTEQVVQVSSATTNMTFAMMGYEK